MKLKLDLEWVDSPITSRLTVKGVPLSLIWSVCQYNGEYYVEGKGHELSGKTFATMPLAKAAVEAALCEPTPEVFPGWQQIGLGYEFQGGLGKVWMPNQKSDEWIGWYLSAGFGGMDTFTTPERAMAWVEQQIAFLSVDAVAEGEPQNMRPGWHKGQEAHFFHRAHGRAQYVNSQIKFTASYHEGVGYQCQEGFPTLEAAMLWVEQELRAPADIHAGATIVVDEKQVALSTVADKMDDILALLEKVNDKLPN